MDDRVHQTAGCLFLDGLSSQVSPDSVIQQGKQLTRMMTATHSWVLLCGVGVLPNCCLRPAS